MEYAWDIFIPGADLPVRIATDYIVTEGETLPVEGATYLVESVQVPDGDEPGVVPTVRVTAPREPAV